MKTIESLQQRLKAKGINPGPIDGIDVSKTFDAWSRYLAATDPAATEASNASEDLAGRQDALSRLLKKAQDDVGNLSTKGDDDTNPDGPEMPANM